MLITATGQLIVGYSVLMSNINIVKLFKQPEYNRWGAISY